jgi:hypothetical protein
MDKIFTEKDKRFLENVLGKMEGAGDWVGSLFNKGTKGLIKIIVIAFSILTFGALLFFWKMLHSAANKKSGV